MDQSDKDFDAVYEAALNILDYSDQFKTKLKAKLSKKGFEKELIDLVINKLMDQELINDLSIGEKYADELVRNKHEGSLKIKARLIEKGLTMRDADLIAKKVIEEHGGEEEVLQQYMEHKKIVMDIKDPIQKQKIIQKLSYQGFTLQAIRNQLRNLADGETDA